MVCPPLCESRAGEPRADFLFAAENERTDVLRPLWLVGGQVPGSIFPCGKNLHPAAKAATLTAPILPVPMQESMEMERSRKVFEQSLVRIADSLELLLKEQEKHTKMLKQVIKTMEDVAEAQTRERKRKDRVRHGKKRSNQF